MFHYKIMPAERAFFLVKTFGCVGWRYVKIAKVINRTAECARVYKRSKVVCSVGCAVARIRRCSMCGAQFNRRARCRNKSAGQR